MRTTIQTNGEVHSCCRDAGNLFALTPDPARPDLTIRVCRVCTRRHITMKAEPGRVGATFGPIGRKPAIT